MTAVAQPAGEVTLVFSDIEGSTRLLEELGTDAYREALAEHRRIVREAYARYSGYEVDYEGDAFFYAFSSAQDAVSAVSDAMAGLQEGPIRIRVGIHSGTPALDPPKYVGLDVHFAARVMSSAHGGQVVLSASTAKLVEAELHELGEHRLKDIAQAVPLFQLGAGRFPPLKTISNTNLPRPASSFLGREAELHEVVSRIEEGARLLTLTGPGGTGKTRLALEAASSLVGSYKAGVFWVGLAALRDPALVSETIAQVLGAKDGLASHIHERELLLLLDNLEQVIEAAPELSALLHACPNLTLLVTSRELLRVSGEVEYPVPPLPQPEAIELFCARAQLEPCEQISQLCARLDNLPLAVELAAARTKALSPAQILERLAGRLDLLKGGRDADPRQQTLRATIEWSYDLLSPEEQALFARLSVFAGGCTLEAAEEVADADLDTLQSLLEKSLLRFTEERYWMLETIREYALERLEASAESERLRGRHAEHFLALAEEADPHVEVELLRGGREWLDRLEHELANFRAALAWLEATAETELSLRLAGALSGFWNGRAHVAEGFGRLERVLRADTRPTAARARALTGGSALAFLSGENAKSGLWADEALVIHRALGDRRGEADALWALGIAAGETGDWIRAQQLLRESLDLLREVGDELAAVWITRTLAWAYAEAGDLLAAGELYEAGLREARKLGSPLAQAALLGSLAWLAVGEGRALDALPLLHQSLAIKREIGDRVQAAIGLSSAARALVAVGRVETAARLISCYESLSEEIGTGESWVTRMNEETLPKIRAHLGDAAFAQAWKEGSALTMEGAVALALEELGRDA